MGRHFQIKFNPTDLQYYLKNLGHGFGTFIKINEWTEIKNNFLLGIGENYIVFTLGIDDDMRINEHMSNNHDEALKDLINLKIFSGNIRHGKLSFSPKQEEFIIGRSPDCDVIIDDNMLSRFHCTVQFRKKKWYIIDGIINKESNKIISSTNGTWKFPFQDAVISDGMIFKANHNLFICSFTNS